MIEVTFLGTAGDCFLSGSQARGTGGVIIRFGKEQYHIDPGPGALVMAKEYGINLRQTTALFVTSPSIIRSNDMNAAIMAMTHAGLDRHGVLFVHKSLHDEHNQFYDHLRKTVAVRAGDREFVKNTEILFTPTTTKTFGLKIFLEKVIGYTGDTNYSKEAAEKLKGCDVLIMSCKPEEALEFLRQIRPKLGIITAYTIKNQNTGEIARALQRKSGVRVVGAEDGMTIDVGNTHGQQHLHKFLKEAEQKISITAAAAKTIRMKPMQKVKNKVQTVKNKVNRMPPKVKKQARKPQTHKTHKSSQKIRPKNRAQKRRLQRKTALMPRTKQSIRQKSANKRSSITKRVRGRRQKRTRR